MRVKMLITFVILTCMTIMFSTRPVKLLNGYYFHYGKRRYPLSVADGDFFSQTTDPVPLLPP